MQSLQMGSKSRYVAGELAQIPCFWYWILLGRELTIDSK